MGYALTALAKYSLILPFLAIHSFSTGGIGLVTLGKMARVSLSHSERLLIPPRMTVLAFALLNVSVLMRVVVPVFPISYFQLWKLDLAIWKSLDLHIFLFPLGLFPHAHFA